VHELREDWTDERKHSYIRHVTREYTIHRELQHPRIVGFFDVFEININSFATVLEYCRGTDLDEKYVSVCRFHLLLLLFVCGCILQIGSRG
jgi:serine/threonine protein kinase